MIASHSHPLHTPIQKRKAEGLDRNLSAIKKAATETAALVGRAKDTPSTLSTLRHTHAVLEETQHILHEFIGGGPR